MGASRQTANLWFYLFGTGLNRQWRFRYFWKQRLWKSPHFFHDTFGVYLWRYLGCPLIRHRTKKLKWVEDDRGWETLYCFRCHRSPIRERVRKTPLSKLPLYINDKDTVVREIAAERLKDGK